MRIGRSNARVRVGLLRRDEVPFLLELWSQPEVMRYADELRTLRGWTRDAPPDEAWRAYAARRAELGPLYSQLVLRTPEGSPLGESFVAPLPDGFGFGSWRKREDVIAVMGDVKLAPTHWGQGLASEGMRKVTRWVFLRTPCELFVVPPHRRNPTAERVYEKAGFVLYEPMARARGHRVMVLTRSRFERLHQTNAASARLEQDGTNRPG